MIRIERDESPRVVFSRAFLDDPRLSLRAKGLLAYVISRVDEGEVDVKGLPVAGERPGEIAAAFRELERAGYFVRSPNGGTSVAGTVRETSALPLLAAGPHRARPAELGAGGEAARALCVSAAAERVLARLNQLRAASWTWARYTPLSAKHAKNVEHIHGRLREGYAETDLVLVLEYLAAIDGGKDTSRKYFDSVTPFNTKNFERNLAMARDWDARGRPAGDGVMMLQRADGHDPAIYEKRVKGGGK